MNWLHGFIIIGLIIVISGTVYTGMDIIKSEHKPHFPKIINAEYVLNKCVHTNVKCFVVEREVKQ